jgi:hypothetical protein
MTLLADVDDRLPVGAQAGEAAIQRYRHRCLDYTAMEAFARKGCAKPPDFPEHVDLPSELPYPLKNSETDQHQRYAGDQADTRPLLAGNTQTIGGYDVRYVTRNKHSAADQQSH